MHMYIYVDLNGHIISYELFQWENDRTWVIFQHNFVLPKGKTCGDWSRCRLHENDRKLAGCRRGWWGWQFASWPPFSDTPVPPKKVSSLATNIAENCGSLRKNAQTYKTKTNMQFSANMTYPKSKISFWNIFSIINHHKTAEKLLFQWIKIVKHF